jgi:hypothetical protein
MSTQTIRSSSRTNICRHLLSGAGRGGGLGALLDRLCNAGHGDAVTSWLGSGQNAPIQMELGTPSAKPLSATWLGSPAYCLGWSAS